jgi:hypothetical protein
LITRDDLNAPEDHVFLVAESLTSFNRSWSCALLVLPASTAKQAVSSIWVILFISVGFFSKWPVG